MGPGLYKTSWEHMFMACLQLGRSTTGPQRRAKRIYIPISCQYPIKLDFSDLIQEIKALLKPKQILKCHLFRQFWVSFWNLVFPLLRCGKLGLHIKTDFTTIVCGRPCILSSSLMLISSPCVSKSLILSKLICGTAIAESIAEEPGYFGRRCMKLESEGCCAIQTLPRLAVFPDDGL
jgi:hypothetical protein